MESQSKRSENFENRCKLGISFLREGFVKAFAPKARFTGNLRQSLGSGDISKSGGDECRIPFFESRLTNIYKITKNYLTIRFGKPCVGCSSHPGGTTFLIKQTLHDGQKE
jgi:hypothetical protein